MTDEDRWLRALESVTRDEPGNPEPRDAAEYELREAWESFSRLLRASELPFDEQRVLNALPQAAAVRRSSSPLLVAIGFTIAASLLAMLMFGNWTNHQRPADPALVTQHQSRSNPAWDDPLDEQLRELHEVLRVVKWEADEHSGHDQYLIDNIEAVGSDLEDNSL